MEALLADWPRPSIAAARHTAYGRVPAADVWGTVRVKPPPDAGPTQPQSLPSELTVADAVDYVLSIGRRREHIADVPNWESFYEPTFVAELNRRRAMVVPPDAPVPSIDDWRTEWDPAMYRDS